MPTDFKNDVIGWDVGVWGRLLKIWSPVLNGPPCQFLELGANKGGLSLWAAKSGHTVICSDYPGVRSSAYELHRRHDIQVGYQAVDALNIKRREIDIIAAKSVLVSVSRVDGFESIRQAICSIYAALKPGGVFLFAENMAGTHVHQIARNRLTKWASQLVYPTDEQWTRLLSTFDRVERHNFGFLSPFGVTQAARSTLGLIDTRLNRHIPDHWKTVTIGVARKAVSSKCLAYSWSRQPATLWPN